MNHANPFHGTRLKELRAKVGYSQHQLSLKLGSWAGTGSQISRYEIGKQRPSDETEQKLCEVFGVEFDYFRK